LAKKAIDECLAATAPPARKVALQTVRLVVETHGKAAVSGTPHDFACAVSGYIQKLMDNLSCPNRFGSEKKGTDLQTVEQPLSRFALRNMK
jgi:hypothetical protein